jgi:hypothetical protein
MGRTPDRFPGTREEDSIKLEPSNTVPTLSGEIRYVTGAGFRFYEEGIEKGLVGSGISDNQHRSLRQLIHLADADGPFEGFISGAYQESQPSGNPFPTSITWWTNSTKTNKIVEENITYNGNKTVATDQWKVYDIDGSTVLATVTDVINYVGIVETSRTRTIT